MEEVYVHCPICGVSIPHVPRYPRYVCGSCANNANDIHGRKLQFFNVSLSGGYQANYTDTGEIYDSHICYINNRKCFADEARFGGIVIQLTD